METLYRPVFIFSKEADDVVKLLGQQCFMELRYLAVEALNPMYEQWNEEFNKNDNGIIDDSDELKDYGGTKYCKFIQSKQKDILAQVNKKLSPMIPWEFDSDEICDIIFRNKYDKELTLTLELQPVTKGD